MKSFFISIIAALGSLFGFHSHHVQPPASTPVVSVQAQSTSTAKTPPPAPLSMADAEQLNAVVTYPVGSDVLQAGQTYNITWQNEGSTTINYSVNLEYVSDGLYINEMHIGTVSSKQETLSFKIPSTILPKTNYQIYFSDPANNNVLFGSQAFTVK